MMKGPSYPITLTGSLSTLSWLQTWVIPDKTKRRIASLSPAQIADCYPRHEKLVHSLNVQFSSRKKLSFFFFFLVWIFNPQNSNLRWVLVSTFFDRLLSKLFTPQLWWDTWLGQITGRQCCLVSVSLYFSRLHPLSVDPWTTAEESFFLSISLVFSGTTWLGLGPFLRVPLHWYPFNSWHFQTSSMCAMK